GGLLFAARGVLKKAAYAAAALVMVLGVVVTYSRGGFLALACASFVMAWKLKRRGRALVLAGFLSAGALLFVLGPSDYGARLGSAFGGGGDGGSAESRQALLVRSVFVSLRHPLLGVGVNNFPLLSIHDKVSHNAYTQVSSEMGMPALAAYVLFMLAALWRMRRVERETADDKKRARVHYIAVGVQASLVGYMVASFFASVAYLWYVYYLVGYALCLDRLYASRGALVFGRAEKKSWQEKAAESSGEGDADFSEEAAGRVPAVALGGGLAARGGR
ncbi:MAG TPA: O-antigen ligase family protein, partial [Pyrinomonadaceae bacterium]